MDKDGSGTISFEEFESVLSTHENLSAGESFFQAGTFRTVMHSTPGCVPSCEIGPASKSNCLQVVLWYPPGIRCFP